MSLIDNNERLPKEKLPALREFISKNRWPLIVAATAALVRIVYLLELSRLPDFVIPMVDEKWHWLWAKEILEGPFFGEGAWFRAPLYPYFLALLAKITGGSILWSKILQALLAGGTAFFTFKLADLLFNRTTAIVAGFIYALYGTLVFYETSFLIPVLFLFFTVWGMYRLVAYSESRAFKSWLLTGVVFGLAIISRPNLLLVMPFLMLWFYSRRDSDQPRSQRLNFLLVLLLGIVIPIAPVTVRNYVKTGDFIMISSQGGVNLYLGNNPIADGLNMQMPEVNLDASVTWRQFGTVVTSAAQREAGRELSPAEESSFWTGKAVDFIAENPGGFVKLVWKKCVYLASGFENSDNADIYHQRTKSTLYSMLVWNKLVYFPFGLLLPFALAGIVLARERSRRLAPIYIFLITYIPSIVLFLVTSRHRLPLVPFLIILASFGIVAMIRLLKKGDWKKPAITAGIVIVGAILFNSTWYAAGEDNYFQIHFNAGIRYEQLEDYARAEQEYQLADDRYPISAALVNNLAWVQAQQGKYAEADRNYHRAINIRPEYARAYGNLGLLVMKKGLTDSALVLHRTALGHYDPDLAAVNELSRINLNLADLFSRMKMTDSADAYFQTALKAGPDYYPAIRLAAVWYARQGEFERTDSLYDILIRTDSLSAGDWFNWGASKMQRQLFDQAIKMMRESLKLNPDMFQAYHSIAVAYHQSGLPRDSVIQYLDLCLGIKPNYVPAAEFKRRLGVD